MTIIGNVDRSTKTAAGRPASFRATLKRAQAGDGRAFGALFESLSGRVHSFVRARGVEDPEATTNEVFLRVFRTIGTFRGSEAAFTGWVFKIARHRVIDEHRARSARVDTVPFTPRSLAAHDARTAADDPLFDDHVAADHMMQLLEQLTADQREVVLLRVVGGLSFEEIARSLDRRSGTVRTIWMRARKTLQQIVGDEQRAPS